VVEKNWSSPPLCCKRIKIGKFVSGGNSSQVYCLAFETPLAVVFSVLLVRGVSLNVLYVANDLSVEGAPL
jgi:hypothetical protein